MRVELQALQRILSQSQVAESFTKLSLRDLAPDLEKNLADGLENSLIYYSNCKGIQTKLSGVKDLGAKFQTLSEQMPSSLLVIAEQIPNDPDHRKMLVRYLAAVTDFLIYSTLGNGNLQKPILESMDPADGGAELREKANDVDNKSYLVSLLKQDLTRLSNLFLKFPVLQGRQEYIEALYVFRGLSAFYYRLYFNLMSLAPKDVMANHLNQVFTIFFVAMRRFEIGHFIKGPMPHNKLDYLIEKDDPKLRHPILRKHIFSMLNNYNPLITDGRHQNFNVTGQKILRVQLETYKNMSTPRMGIFLMTIKKLKGKGYFQELLASLQRASTEHIFKLRDFLNEKEAPEAQELCEDIQTYLQKITGKVQVGQGGQGKPIKTLQSQETIRQAAAKRKISANKNRKGMMTQDDITNYLEERLKKLYAAVRKEGALTQDKIGEYLAQFAESSLEIMEDRELSDEEIAAFEASTVGLLNDIAEEGGANSADLVVQHQQIRDQSAELKTASLEERAEIVSNMGIALHEAKGQLEIEKRTKAATRNPSLILEEQIIPIGLEENAPKVLVKEFLGFPLGPRGGHEDDDEWFSWHLKYFSVLKEKVKLTEDQFEQIEKVIPMVEKFRYRKYFDIFPGDNYEDTVMMAVFSLWENKALDKLRET